MSIYRVLPTGKSSLNFLRARSRSSISARISDDGRGSRQWMRFRYASHSSRLLHALKPASFPCALDDPARSEVGILSRSTIPVQSKNIRLSADMFLLYHASGGAMP